MPLIRTTADIFMIAPPTRVVIPVLDFASPLLLKFFPKMLSSSIIRKPMDQEAIKRKERQQHTEDESFGLAATAAVVLFAMSLMEFLLSKMVPPTSRERNNAKEPKSKNKICKISSRYYHRSVEHILSSRSGDLKQTAEELDEFIDKVKRGATVSSKEIMGFAKLFNNDVSISKYLQVPGYHCTWSRCIFAFHGTREIEMV
ncbi:hypothetical protein OROHE_020011 [Orobanche hederae]